jgi:hypothetical protein
MYQTKIKIFTSSWTGGIETQVNDFTRNVWVHDVNVFYNAGRNELVAVVTYHIEEDE